MPAMKWVSAVLLVWTVLGVQGDDCAPPAPGYKTVPAWKCCPVDDFVPKDMNSKVKDCVKKYPMVSKPNEIPHMSSCAAQCVYKEAGYMTKDDALDKKTITSRFTGIAKVKTEYVELLNKMLDKCFEYADKQVDSSSECKSGALELSKCLMRDTFLNCPKALWKNEGGCDDLKEKVKKCPHFPVLLVRPISVTSPNN